MNLVQVSMIGNLVADPVVVQLPDGRTRTRFTVAATSRIQDTRTGRWRDGETTFLTCVAWRKLAAAAGALRKGERVVVVGQLRQYDYARDGAPQRGYEVQAQDIGRCLALPVSNGNSPDLTAPRPLSTARSAGR